MGQLARRGPKLEDVRLKDRRTKAARGPQLLCAKGTPFLSPTAASTPPRPSAPQQTATRHKTNPQTPAHNSPSHLQPSLALAQNYYRDSRMPTPHNTPPPRSICEYLESPSPPPSPSPYRTCWLCDSEKIVDPEGTRGRYCVLCGLVTVSAGTTGLRPWSKGLWGV
ncbi:hypothetical protein NMY22_g14155 [Coprinellus aureogranulatus]|nr:hypothetical protein NMY22_g14155 [Coprinellus aureogranulatus]